MYVGRRYTMGAKRGPRGELRSPPGAAFHPRALWGRWTFSRVLVISPPSYAGVFTSCNSYKLINFRDTRPTSQPELNARFRRRSI